MKSFFERSKDSIDQIKTVLENAGHTVEMNYYKFERNVQNNLYHIWFDQLRAVDVKEIDSGTLSIAIMIRHSNATPSSLMDTADAVNELFDSYVLSNKAIGMKFAQMENYYDDTDKSRGILMMWYDLTV